MLRPPSMRISPGSLSTLVGISGTGLAMALPDYRWVGWALVALALAIFIIQVRWENGSLKAQWPHGNKMIPLIGMILSVIAFIGFGLWYQASAQEGVNLKIQNISFDPNGPGEIYLNLQLSNLGPPTTVDDWRLSIIRSGRAILDDQPPRLTYPPKLDQFSGKIEAPDDLARRPLQTGEKVQPRFTWTYQGNAKEEFWYPGTRFHLTARDIREREISADFFVP
jgi:hypothetical protein